LTYHLEPPHVTGCNALPSGRQHQEPIAEAQRSSFWANFQTRLDDLTFAQAKLSGERLRETDYRHLGDKRCIAVQRPDSLGSDQGQPPSGIAYPAASLQFLTLRLQQRSLST
jgi:hypothetical protein